MFKLLTPFALFLGLQSVALATPGTIRCEDSTGLSFELNSEYDTGTVWDTDRWWAETNRIDTDVVVKFNDKEVGRIVKSQLTREDVAISIGSYVQVALQNATLGDSLYVNAGGREDNIGGTFSLRLKLADRTVVRQSQRISCKVTSLGDIIP